MRDEGTSPKERLVFRVEERREEVVAKPRREATSVVNFDAQVLEVIEVTWVRAALNSK